MSWLPIFIKDGLGVPMAAVGLLAMLPHIASFIFINIGGYFADYLTNKGIRLLTVRKLCNSIAFGGSGICLCIVPELESVAGIIAIMCLGNVFGGFSAGGFIVNHADIGPKHTGRLMGITNMVAALPGLVRRCPDRNNSRCHKFMGYGILCRSWYNFLWRNLLFPLCQY